MDAPACRAKTGPRLYFSQYLLNGPGAQAAGSEGRMRQEFWYTMNGIHMPHFGRHFLQIPGPTNVPDRILRAMAQPTIDHRGPEFAKLGAEVLEGVRAVFKTSGPVVIFPSSGT